MEQKATQSARPDNASADVNGDAPSLQRSLARWSAEFTAGGRSRWPRIIHDPDYKPRRTIAAAKAIAKGFENIDPKPPSQYDINQLHRRVRASWTDHASLDHLSPRDLWRLPWVLFYTPYSAPDAQSWLGAIPALVSAYDRWLTGGRKARPILALLSEFLRVYPVGLPTFDDLRRLLIRSISAGDSPSTQRWRQRCHDFSLLEKGADLDFVHTLVAGYDSDLGTTGPHSLRPGPARQGPEPDTAADIGDVLWRLGFDGKLARCEFLKSGAIRYLPEVDQGLRKGSVEPAQLDRLLALLECDDQLRFREKSMRTEIATRLLGPFRNRTPDNVTQLPLQAFFLRHFGDPRLPSKRPRWSGVPDAVKHVLIRWLVKQTLEEFFGLLAETALDRHWNYRQQFWMAYFGQDLIDDAWFALGPDATRLLKRIRNHRESTTAVLRRAQGDQSVLLMRMSGGVTVAEWSHNGSCRMWLDGNRNAPLLYRAEYSRGDLMNGSDLSQRHDGSQSGRWQKKIEDWLRDNTGVLIERRGYTASAAW